MGVGVGEQFLVQGGRKGGEGRKEGIFFPLPVMDCSGDLITWPKAWSLFRSIPWKKTILVDLINFQYTFSKHISDIVNTRKTVEKI